MVGMFYSMDEREIIYSQTTLKRNIAFILILTNQHSINNKIIISSVACKLSCHYENRI